MKCPNCKKEIDEHSQYCPYCGTKIQPVMKKDASLPKIMVLLLIMSLLSGLIYGKFTNKQTGILDNSKLSEVSGDATYIVATYHSIDDFTSAYTNANSYLSDVYSFENKLKKEYEDVNASYTIYVFNNNDVSFGCTCTFTYLDLNMSFYHLYDYANTVDQYTYTFKKENQTAFDDLMFSTQEITFISDYVNSKTVDKIIGKISKREDEFEKTKKTLGHYGMGEYDDNISFVIKRYSKTYTSELTYNKED